MRGRLVEVQRSTPEGFETVAVVAEDLLVMREPPECAKVEIKESKEANGREAVKSSSPPWYPVGQPLD